MGKGVLRLRLDGSVALVTGASSGIGAEVACRLADAGSATLLAGRDEGRLKAVAARTGGTVLVEDLAARAGASRLARQALDAAGQVDLVVHSAGIGWAGDLATMPAADIERLTRTNLLAPMELTRALVPGMIQRQRGWVAFVGSIAGATGVGGETVYSGVKGGLHTYAESLRLELAPAGVGVTVVVPGAVDTPFFDNRGSGYQRRWPPPIPPSRVATALVGAVTAGRPEVFVPGWMGLAARVRGGVPGLYRALARRFG